MSADPAQQLMENFVNAHPEHPMFHGSMEIIIRRHLAQANGEVVEFVGSLGGVLRRECPVRTWLGFYGNMCFLLTHHAAYDGTPERYSIEYLCSHELYESVAWDYRQERNAIEDAEWAEFDEETFHEDLGHALDWEDEMIDRYGG